MENFEDNLEKEYHERFHDFEEIPDDALWAKIQDRITPESERRPVIFWWQTFRMGIAASLLIGLLLGGYYYSTKKDFQTNKILLNKASISKINATKSTPKNQETKEKTSVLSQVFQQKKEKEIIKFVQKNNEIVAKSLQNQAFEGIKNEILLSENIINKKRSHTTAKMAIGGRFSSFYQ